MHKLKIEKIAIHERTWIGAHVPYDRTDWREKVKNIQGRYWHTDEKLWLIPYHPDSYRHLKNLIGPDNIEVMHTPTPRKLLPPRLPLKIIQSPKKALVKPQLSEQYSQAVSNYEDKLRLLRYSYETLKNYRNTFILFCRYFEKQYHSVSDIPKEAARQYMLKLIRDTKMSTSGQNQLVSALKFYFEKVLGQDKTYYDLERPRENRKLPNILSREEVKKLFAAVGNQKHKCILMMLYSAGLRLSEVVNLRRADVWIDRGQVFVKNGKGGKDRMTTLSPKMVIELEKYWQEYSAHYWLFEGQTGGQYSKRSVQEIMKQAVIASGVNPYVTVHSLRHSFATHLYEGGMSSRSIQQLLGHESLETTERYTHLTEVHRSNLRSPLDDL
jgi:site-specific recombinase XerD